MPPAVFSEANDFIVRVWLDRKFYVSFTSFNIRSQEVKGNGGGLTGHLESNKHYTTDGDHSGCQRLFSATFWEVKVRLMKGDRKTKRKRVGGQKEC